MDADGSNQVRVTDNPGIDEYPTWSPDGTRIAFHCTMGGVNPNGTGDFEICVMNRDGTGLHRLTDTPGENTQPDWSPDGEWIVVRVQPARLAVAAVGDARWLRPGDVR